MTTKERRELVLEDKVERLRAALEHIESWSRSYPLAAFPEPDLERAAKLLRDGGLSLDVISASCMRHALTGVGEIAREALLG